MNKLSYFCMRDTRNLLITSTSDSVLRTDLKILFFQIGDGSQATARSEKKMNVNLG